MITKQVHFKYDAFDRRIAKQVDADGNGTIDRQSRYVYDGEDVALVYDETGSLENRYLHGPGVDQVFADENALGEVLWALADNLGTVRDIADYDPATDSTTVANHRRFNSFGKITSESNPGVDFLFAYTGRYFDEDTGLQWNLNRWLDSDGLRWLSQDPIGFAAGDPNLNRYVGNSPTNLIDPNGLAGLRPITDEQIRDLEDLLPRYPGEDLDAYLAQYGYFRVAKPDWLRPGAVAIRSDEPAITRVPGVFGGSVHLNDAYFANSPFGIPTVVCHGVTAQGLVGPPNSFRFPGGPAQLEYYQNWRDTAASLVASYGIATTGAFGMAAVGPEAIAAEAADSALEYTTGVPIVISPTDLVESGVRRGGKELAEGIAESAARRRGWGNIGCHDPVSTDVVLDSAGKWLRPGYKELAPGVFRSADGLRQFRMTTRDLIPTHGNLGPHVHFEALNAPGEVIENLHIPLTP